MRRSIEQQKTLGFCSRVARLCEVHVAWDDESAAVPEPSANLTDTVPSADGEESVDYWAGEVLRIGSEIMYNVLKAKLAFARGRHRQTVRAREVKVWPALGPKEVEELVAASPVAAERVQGACLQRRRGAPVERLQPRGQGTWAERASCDPIIFVVSA